MLYESKGMAEELEIWKPITGYGLYEVSNKARIRNSDTKQIIKQFVRGRGYWLTRLSMSAIKRRVAWANL
jgi:hypothetical protein